MVLDANGPSLRTLVVNPGFMFGSHRGEFRGEEVIARVLQSRVVVCTSGGLSVVHVDDVVDGVRRAVARGRAGERYILSGENVSFHEIAETVVEVSNRKKLLVDIPRAIGGFAGSLLNAIPAFSKSGRFLYLHPAYAYPFYDSTRARQELGYQARPFREIVSDYLHFSRERRLTAPAE